MEDLHISYLKKCILPKRCRIIAAAVTLTAAAVEPF